MMKTFTKILCAVVAMFAIAEAEAQQGYEKNNEIFRLGVESRFDYIREALDGDEIYDASGFKARYFNLRMDGQIAPKFTYSWRQRFSRPNEDASFVNSTDWLHLTYRPNANWAISAGKQVVMIGGWEYDRAPIDIYYCSEYWNNVNCFALGASVTYTTDKGNDSFTFQICQSPYDKMDPNYRTEIDETKTDCCDYCKPRTKIKLGDLYAYNLYYMGSHGCYTALHSVNFSAYAPDKYTAYVVLGNQFKSGDATLQLDIMNRGITAKELLFKNYSIMAEFSYLFGERVNAFAKVTYDKAGADYATGLFVYPNTDIKRIGGGIEFYPMGHLGNRDVRLHAAYVYNIGENGNLGGVAQDKGSFFTLGLTWRIDALQGLKAALK